MLCKASHSIHCIISGAGLTPSMKLVSCRKNFFIPVKVLGALFRGKFMDALEDLYNGRQLMLKGPCSGLVPQEQWRSFRDSLYRKDWCPFIKETFNGFGNAIDYLGRYSHRIAISNARIEDVSENSVTFRAKDYRTGGVKYITITHEEFIRRFLQHVLPAGFQKIRYYGILTNSLKKKRLEIIFRIQNHRRFRSKYSGMETDVKLFEMFGIDIHICPCCGERSLR